MKKLFFAEKPNQEGHIGLVPGYTGEFKADKTDTLPAAIQGCSKKINPTKNKPIHIKSALFTILLGSQKGGIPVCQTSAVYFMLTFRSLCICLSRMNRAKWMVGRRIN